MWKQRVIVILMIMVIIISISPINSVLALSTDIIIPIEYEIQEPKDFELYDICNLLIYEIRQHQDLNKFKIWVKVKSDNFDLVVILGNGIKRVINSLNVTN